MVPGRFAKDKDEYSVALLWKDSVSLTSVNNDDEDDNDPAALHLLSVFL